MNNSESLYTIRSEWHNYMGDLIRSENLYFNDKNDAYNRYSELRDNPDVPKGTYVIVKLCNPSMRVIRCFTAVGNRFECKRFQDYFDNCKYNLMFHCQR